MAFILREQSKIWFINGDWCKLLRQNATRFLLDDVYKNPGPFQFDGPDADSKAVIE
ncbi:hypothetical protein Hanom_Chr03g00225831 [Helianthus anomalus]